ncbi:hypothetical protein QEH52_03305 [Coraliomargarita sp. SDUM461003]|uniref:Roadblock/LAMTOR2 domain-containing protein n=1 Tax=Thalassobacterium maritimum TaxID=3041265 RepID=A0ABU1AQU5_9BACT|nr:hypothetical protein [Coraliomargarita sp. SDUM461003]MDQ8206520.1 hypothetical protein [Coraliomargarita sp. SDUM461003]
MIDKIIKNVLELPGVDGACILDKKGNLLHNALPEFFLDSFLDDLARRIKTLYEAVDENYMPCDDYLLKFPQKYIRLRRSRHVFLLVAIDPNVNLVSLRMVTNIVLKHITPKVVGEMRAILAEPPVQETATPEPAQAAVPTPTPAPTPAPQPAPAAEPTNPEPAPENKAPARGERVARPRPSRSFRGTRY